LGHRRQRGLGRIVAVAGVRGLVGQGATGLDVGGHVRQREPQRLEGR
jgi:hypothetical protein